MQRLSQPLRDAVASGFIDPFYVTHPVGTALTVTTDGYVEGQGRRSS